MTTTRASLRRVAAEAARRPRDRDGHAIRDARTPAEKTTLIAEGHAEPGRPEGREPGPDEIGTRRTIVIERISPEIDGGRHPAKRVVGDHLLVTAPGCAPSAEPGLDAAWRTVDAHLAAAADPPPPTSRPGGRTGRLASVADIAALSSTS